MVKLVFSCLNKRVDAYFFIFLLPPMLILTSSLPDRLLGA